jgi:hypothetical protein
VNSTFVPQPGAHVHRAAALLERSFWFPGSTIFAVLTAVGTEVRWLPEQDGRLAERWSQNADGSFKQEKASS